MITDLGCEKKTGLEEEPFFVSATWNDPAWAAVGLDVTAESSHGEHGLLCGGIGAAKQGLLFEDRDLSWREYFSSAQFWIVASNGTQSKQTPSDRDEKPLFVETRAV